MSIPTFTPGYPPDGSSLGQTKSTIRDNLDGTFETLGIDHINNNGQPGSNPAGYHNVIHQVLQSVDPVAITNINQVYAKNYTPSFPGATADTQLFSRTGNGGVSQLTGNHAIANGGWNWCGGILLIWGNVTTNFSTGTGTVTFNSVSGNTTSFPNAIFQVLTSMNGTSGTANLVEITSLSQTSFSWKFTGGSGATSYTGFSWLAIGN